MTPEPTKRTGGERTGKRIYQEPTLVKLGLLRDLTQRNVSSGGAEFSSDPSDPDKIHVRF